MRVGAGGSVVLFHYSDSQPWLWVSTTVISPKHHPGRNWPSRLRQGCHRESWVDMKDLDEKRTGKNMKVLKDKVLGRAVQQGKEKSTSGGPTHQCASWLCHLPCGLSTHYPTSLSLLVLTDEMKAYFMKLLEGQK